MGPAWFFGVLLLCNTLASAAGANPTCRAGHTLTLQELHVTPFEALHQLDAAALLADHATITSIRFVRQNVFPHKNYWLARQANRFNILTSRRALQAALPFATGDTVSGRVLAETERILRAKSFLYDAVILVRERCDHGIAIDVITREVWTLTPGVGFNRSGGDNETNVSLSDVNFLGSGKSLSVEYSDDRDRSGASLSFDDPNISGSRWAAQLAATENDDGQRYGASLSRPFFSLDTRLAFGVDLDHFVRVRDLEFLGRDAFELDVESDAANLFVARSRGRDNGWIDRQFLGVRYLDEDIRFPQSFPDVTQIDRRFAYPYIGWQRIQERFEERRDVRRVGITEDVQLGWTSYVELGWSSERTGGDGEYLLAQGSGTFREFLKDKHLLSLSAEFRGRYDLDSSQAEDVMVELNGAVLLQQAPKWRFETSASYVHTENLQPDKQLTLGGDTGLRGYPSRYQPGDRRLLLTLEQRYYSDAQVFGLLRVGYAAFLDLGRAWFHDEAPAWVPPRDGDHFDTLANVGLGLRLESIRTRRDRVFHIDIARPLVDGPGVDTWELTLSGKQRF